MHTIGLRLARLEGGVTLEVLTEACGCLPVSLRHRRPIGAPNQRLSEVARPAGAVPAQAT
jgi:hypothetical protein